MFLDVDGVVARLVDVGLCVGVRCADQAEVARGPCRQRRRCVDYFVVSWCASSVRVSVVRL